MILSKLLTDTPPTSIIDKLNDPLYLTDIILASVVSLFLLVCVFLFFKKKTAKAIYIIAILINLCCVVFDLKYSSLIITAFLIIIGVTSLFFNLGYVKEILQNPASFRRGKATVKNASNPEITYNKDKFVKDVTTAVLKLSSTKTGAIMTFEKKMNLNDYMKNGTIINCPFTPEIVETIFYVGTRLHDGAIIVRKNTIIAASVYYTPSTKALTGKFGARHRAALGISEATDSVTVICSEETGRISIAYNGKLESVKRDEFAVIFKGYLDN